MWDWSLRRLCNTVHILLCTEWLSDEDEAEKWDRRLTSADMGESEERKAIADTIAHHFPGAIVGGSPNG